jgi:hypothetical protein
MIGAIMMPAKARQHGAEAEHDHEQALDIDAERRDHPGIGGAGPHQHADPGERHHHIEAGGDREPRAMMTTRQTG